MRVWSLRKYVGTGCKACPFFRKFSEGFTRQLHRGNLSVPCAILSCLVQVLDFRKRRAFSHSKTCLAHGTGSAYEWDNLQIFSGLETWDLFGGQSRTSGIHPHQNFSKDHSHKDFLCYFPVGKHGWKDGRNYNAQSNIIITVWSIDFYFLVIPLPSSSKC